VNTILRLCTDLDALIDANDDIEAAAPHASPEFCAAQTRGNALRHALRALQELQPDDSP